MLTPLKSIKGMPNNLIFIDIVANELLLKAVSSVRQPIEVLFGWLINKTNTKCK